jgi:hypothetical protein
MKSLLRRLGRQAMLAGLVIACAGVARADRGPDGQVGTSGDPYAFGFSGNVAQTLTLTLSDSSTLTLDTSGPLATSGLDQGWYDNTGLHESSNSNYIVGPLSLDYHNYFTFALPTLGAGLSVTGATLNLFTYDVEPPGYNPTYTLYDVSTSAATLNADQSGAVGIYNDLGSGTQYGSYVITTSSVTINIGLDGAAIAGINAGLGNYFSIGGSVDTPSVVTPEPSTLAIAGLGGLGLVFYARRRKK